MKWTTAADVKSQLERHWMRGDICRASVGEEALFPLRLPFRMPPAKVMLDAFADLQDWVKSISGFAGKHALQLEWREINHRSLGKQSLPGALLFDSPEQAAMLIGKRQSLRLFGKLYKAALTQLPELQCWLLKRPLKALELERAWPQLVDLCLWIRAHPNPGVYLRQVSLTGVDSKFIEAHRQVLAELFDLVLPVYAINDDFSGVPGFARRYGFLDKPLMLRVRPLDASIRLLHADGAQDVVMMARTFARLGQEVQSQTRRVFMVENEINYLAFPGLSDALIVFGSGYGFDALKQARWLDERELYYWGDLDTHGFAILNQLRAVFPRVRSFLMDGATLMAHRSAWGVEPKQETKDLRHLTAEEAAVYDDLRFNRYVEQLRLEQERIAFAAVTNAAGRL